MRTVTLEELLEAGCHFGHQVFRQNPKMRDYIFEARDNIHIIDLEKTKEGLEEAANYVRNLAKNGGSMLMLGTKRQAQEVLVDAINKFTDTSGDGIYWVMKRWIGGTFTNLPEVSKNFRKLKDLERDLKDENAKTQFTKREIGEWEKDREKLEGFYGGIVSMTKVPDAIFIIDTHLENLAVREARAMGVKIVGITDTNSDPTIIDYPIPANDDAVGSIELIAKYILDAWMEGRKSFDKLRIEKAQDKSGEYKVDAPEIKEEMKEKLKEKEPIIEKKSVEKKETKKRKIIKKKEEKK